MDRDFSHSPRDESTLDFKKASLKERFTCLCGGISPRPIALVSTIDKEGKVNLSPFSFFNVFSSTPPILIFSPALGGREKIRKHSLDNVSDCPEAVIHVVTRSMVEQASLSSVAYPKGVNEFVKAGFTAIPSSQVRPPRVAESPVAFECQVQQIISLGTEGGAGQLVLAEVLLSHVHKRVLDKDGLIDPVKLNPVARLGKDYYAEVNAQSLFEVEKPVGKKSLGVDALPSHIHHLGLSGNEIGKLGGTEQLPSPADCKAFRSQKIWQEFQHDLNTPSSNPSSWKSQALSHVQKLLHKNQIQEALLLLSQPEWTSEKLS
ncbi:MAG: flavin reductase family protein [Cytophagales bacterium]|nr:flavin reductase family protein [Cytophagales bacterium]